jgi:nicotinamidase/pyrazinamidase
MFLVIVTLVGAFVWHKPENLTFDKDAHLAGKKAVYDAVNRSTGVQKGMDYNEAVIEQIGSRAPNLPPAEVASGDEGRFRDALVVVDIQNDFFEDGALPVPNAESLIPVLNETIRAAEAAGLLIVFTQDWHTLEHSSFIDNGGEWKPHCISETFGAALHKELYRPAGAKLVKFGVEPELDGYSPFENPLLDQTVNLECVKRIFVAGIALEYCVYATCKDARERNKEVIAVESLIRAASVTHSEKTWRRLAVLEVTRAADVEVKEMWSAK